MTDPETIEELHAVAQESLAELRLGVAVEAADYVLALEHAGDSERRWAQDPDRRDLEQAALEAIAELESARDAFRAALKTARAARTRRLSSTEG